MVYKYTWKYMYGWTHRKLLIGEGLFDSQRWAYDPYKWHTTDAYAIITLDTQFASLNTKHSDRLLVMRNWIRFPISDGSVVHKLVQLNELN